MKLFERIDLIAQKKCGSRAKLAQLLGEKQNTFNGYFTEDRQDKFKAVHLERILDLFPDINPVALLTGKGDLFGKLNTQPETGLVLPNQPDKAAELKPALGPVAQRVDGIERAAKGTPLIDLIPFVVTNLRAWYGQEAKRLGVDAREPGAAVYAQEGGGQRRTRILDDKERDDRLAKLERMIDGNACGIDQDPSTGTVQLMALGRDRPPEKKQPNKRSRD